MADQHGRCAVFMMSYLVTTEPVSFIIVMGLFLLGLGASMMTSAGISIIGGNLTDSLTNRTMGPFHPRYSIMQVDALDATHIGAWIFVRSVRRMEVHVGCLWYHISGCCVNLGPQRTSEI
ncbi:hypothetical protein NEOLEDRAFT_518700 [Neolentinus lepideus HHB14362 ss-1]|uniref:Uncharacterized protein n=1 Tax=Neolentinus lepideus HHB14362 ss-1 TaxID=1314782 RepID=A0A165RHV0_9AGAM|nr:hypothetical protein NEOLEDRAFT_518700 [Neolentinus lepideus HHB14362 ss-1]